MHEVLVNRLGGLSLPRKSVVRLTDRPDMTLDVYCGRKTSIQPTNKIQTDWIDICYFIEKCLIYIRQNISQIGPKVLDKCRFTVFTIYGHDGHLEF